MSQPRNPQTAAMEALIEAHATELKLPTVKARFRQMAAEATREQQTPTAYLAALLDAEMAERAERRERRRLLEARFPMLKRLEEFRFADNPKIPQATIAALAEGSWIDDREGVVLIGDSDPGSHCPPRCRHWSKSPAPLPDTLILRPFRRPLTTWTASSSPRWTLCKTVWRAHPSRCAASASGR
jgi:IstB-like ATP binding protein